MRATEIYTRRNIKATLDGSELEKVRAARARIDDALAEPVSDAVRTKLEEARDRLDEALGTEPDPTTTAARGPVVAQRRLPLERARTVPRRGRTIADLINDVYREEGTR